MSENMRVNQSTIANILGVSCVTVNHALKGNASPAMVEAVKRVATELHYENMRDPAVKERKAKAKAENTYYCGGNFHTKDDERQRMAELRAEGYTNKEIAARVGRTVQTVRRVLKPQDPAMTLMNRQMGQKIRAMKNAARKKYVQEAPIREYNKKVEEHNAIKAKLMAMEVELSAKTAKMEAIAAAPVMIPGIDMKSLTPTPLM